MWINLEKIILKEKKQVTKGHVNCDATHEKFQHTRSNILLMDIIIGTKIKICMERICTNLSGYFRGLGGL